MVNHTAEPAFSLKSIDDLRWVFERIIDEILPSKMDLGIKGRVIAQLLTVGVKLIETSELQERMNIIEQRLGIAEWPT